MKISPSLLPDWFWDYDPEPEQPVQEPEHRVSVSHLFPLLHYFSTPEISLTQIKERRFNLIERSQDLERAQNQAAEDERILAVLDYRLR